MATPDFAAIDSRLPSWTGCLKIMAAFVLRTGREDPVYVPPVGAAQAPASSASMTIKYLPAGDELSAEIAMLLIE